jgi:hypothetical protein
MKFQVHAIHWISILLYMMMDRTGANCSSVSLPYLEIDILYSSDHNNKTKSKKEQQQQQQKQEEEQEE